MLLASGLMPHGGGLACFTRIAQERQRDHATVPLPAAGPDLRFDGLDFSVPGSGPSAARDAESLHFYIGGLTASRGDMLPGSGEFQTTLAAQAQLGLAPQSQTIAPALVLRGEGAWNQAIPVIAGLCRRPLLLGRSSATSVLRTGLAADLASADLAPVPAELRHDCCEQDLQPLAELARAQDCDAVIAAGGGKVLDAGKLLADRLGLRCVTLPTSAATCAGWTALANLYSAAGAFQRDVALRRCPDLLVFDHGLVRQAPARTLVSGIADAMAKWYEASVSSGTSSDALVQLAVQMARVLRDQLLLESEAALAEPGGEAWVRVAEAAALSAGLIGGIGGASCRTVAAHAVHNGLTQLPASHGHLHGEKVGFGILVQLRLEEQLGGSRLAAQARRQLLGLFERLGLPRDLGELGLAGSSLVELQQACAFACSADSDLHRLPFAVGPTELLAALVSTTADCLLS